MKGTTIIISMLVSIIIGSIITIIILDRCEKKYKAIFESEYTNECERLKDNIDCNLCSKLI